MSFTYPDITDLKLLPFKIIKGGMTDDPTLLDRPECPYSDSVKSTLKYLLSATIVGPAATAEDGFTDYDPSSWGGGSSEFDTVDEKVKALLHRLDQIALKVDIKDTSEQIQIAKAQSQLYDRLLAMRERAMNQKAVAQFTEYVLEMIDRHLPPDNRTAIMTEMRERLGL